MEKLQQKHAADVFALTKESPGGGLQFGFGDQPSRGMAPEGMMVVTVDVDAPLSPIELEVRCSRLLVSGM